MPAFSSRCAGFVRGILSLPRSKNAATLGGMNPQLLIEEIANRADDFLRGVTNPSEAHNAIVELLASEHPALTDETRRQIADAVMRILHNEDFFAMTAATGGCPDDDDTDDETE